MRKIYRISVFNKTTEKRELLWNVYTSLSAAKKVANNMNKVDPTGSVQARVLEIHEVTANG